MRKERGKKLVQGVGINDVDTVVFKRDPHKGTEWMCPYYKTWKNMLTRCYNRRALLKDPTYKGCYVSDEWLYFSNFKDWMKQQNWKGNDLDKDLLVGGNKVYSKETCVFVTTEINTVLTSRRKGQYPLGCSPCKGYKKPFQALCNNSGSRVRLGYYDTPMEAHRVWQLQKIQNLTVLKDKSTQDIVKNGLQRVIDKIQYNYDNNLETINFT